MQTIIRVMILIIFVCTPFNARAEDDCLCPKVSCNETCEIEKEIKFYTEKCGGGERVRSCARPTCVKLDPLPQSCGVPKVSQASESDRAPSSVKEEVKAPKVGVVEKLLGEAWLLEGETKKEALSIGSIISEQDVIETAKNARIEIRFDDGNLILVGSGSRIDLKKVEISPDQNQRKTSIELLKGKIRSKVTKSVTGASYFNVKTRSAVAGVRGTDFVVSLNEDLNADQVSTQVETLTGEVELLAADDSEKAIVGARETASYVVNGFNAREAMKDFTVKGRMTPVTKISPEQAASIDKEFSVIASQVEQDREVASVKIEPAGTCDKPKAEFNQCSWVCVNNPKGEKTCRTDKPGVDCVRRVCKASGKWSDQMRLPASFGSSCDPEKVIVAPCDY